jgi:hypothetical protein
MNDSVVGRRRWAEALSSINRLPISRLCQAAFHFTGNRGAMPTVNTQPVKNCGQITRSGDGARPPVGKARICPQALENGYVRERGCEHRVRISFIPAFSTGCSIHTRAQLVEIKALFKKNKGLRKLCAAKWDNWPLWTKPG